MKPEQDKIFRVVVVLLLVLIAMMILGILAVINFEGEGAVAALFTPPSTAAPTPSPSPPPTPEPTPVPTPEPTPELRERTELLTLVNPWHFLPEDYEPELEWIFEEQYIDTRCAEPLRRMIADCEAAGNYPYICSGYRSAQTQENLYENKILRLILAGIDSEDAPGIAARSVAYPGTSEHQLGLAVDIIDYFYTNLDAGQEDTDTQKWLMENCWRYGFILRYPNGTSDITGIIYEPWHYRYVGEDCAREISELGVTLEEYLDMFYKPLE